MATRATIIEMLSLRWLAFLSLVWVSIANGEQRSRPAFFVLEAGAYVNNVSQRLSAPSGYASKLSSLKGYFRVHPGFHLGKNWYFEPSFGTMIPTRDGADGSTSAFESQLALQIGVPLFRFLRFRLGPGIEWVLLMSKNESVVLRNGTDSSTFYTPGRTTNVFLFTATAGLTFRMHERWMLGLDVYIPQLLNSSRRRYQASMTVGFRL